MKTRILRRKPALVLLCLPWTVLFQNPGIHSKLQYVSISRTAYISVELYGFCLVEHNVFSLEVFTVSVLMSLLVRKLTVCVIIFLQWVNQVFLHFCVFVCKYPTINITVEMG